MRDILMVLSDQHAFWATGFGGAEADTPNLERIAGEGCRFDRCYCSAPLCVPSRMSFLSGLLPSELGIFNNDAALPGDVPTLAHDLGARGYRTVLIGRMHFKGDDQRHGFDERLVGDITSQYWGTGGKNRTDFGTYAGTTNRKHCLEAVGGGYSPVMAYDEAVLQAAGAYLDGLARMDQEGKEREPVFLLVGFYGPHFPFACRADLYEKYKKRLEPEEEGLMPLPEYQGYVQECGAEKRRNCRAAYYGLVETLDGYVGELYDRFSALEREAGKPYAFLYTSDHGEQLGKRGIFGKQTLYEDAVRVPLVLAGTGIPSGDLRKTPVSLLDLSAGLVQMSETEAGLPEALEARKGPVRIQQMVETGEGLALGEAAIRFPYKAVRIGGRVRVYDLENDPDETKDLAGERPDLACWAGEGFLTEEEQDRLLCREREQRKQHQRLKAWGEAKRPREEATVTVPEAARQRPAE